MKPTCFAATIAALMLVACTENPIAPDGAALSPSLSRAAARPYTFTRIDVPGSTSTVVSGINADGKLVGWYAAGGVTRGFTYQDGVYTTNIVYPGAALTQLRGISSSGDMAGSYRNPGEPTVNFHGFVLTADGAFIPVDFPGHTNTIAQRLLPDGTVLGCYHDVDMMASMHGATIERGDGYSSISAFASMTNGGTPGGDTFAGLFTDMDTGLGRAFVIDHGNFTGFDAPGSDFTAAWDMNPAGTIVGLFETAGTTTTHGFVLEHWRVVDGAVVGQYTTIDYPLSATTNAAYTDVFGINASGDIVGKFRETATGPFHGYFATRRTGE